MKKFIIALLALPFLALSFTFPVRAETTTTTDNTTVTSGTVLACMQTAVGKREDAIISAFSLFGTSMTANLTTRKNALMDAWKIANKKERNLAREAAWKAYRDSAEKAREALRSARKGAWDGFRTDRKACGSPATDTTTMDTVVNTL